MPSPVHAEEQEDEALTPYERRQRDLAKRRELLKEAREKALLKASGVQETTTLESDAKVEATNAEQQNTAEEVKEPASAFQQRKPTPPPVAAPVAPPPAPVEEAKPAFRFSAPKPAPPPAVVVPPPAPAPVVVVPQKVAAPAPPSKPSPAPEQKAVPKKRRGPLPTFLAELLVLGFYAAFFTAITKYNAEVGDAVNKAKAAVVSLYEKVEKAVPADFK